VSSATSASALELLAGLRGQGLEIVGYTLAALVAPRLGARDLATDRQPVVGR